MKLAAAQIGSVRGDVAANIRTHLAAIATAVDLAVDCVVFPELSLTGYEPELAAELAFRENDRRLQPIADAVEKDGLTAVVGAPLVAEGLPLLGALVLSPDGNVSSYAKMNLHPGEEFFFLPGDRHRYLRFDGTTVALAVCADTNAPDHARQCAADGAHVYAAGVMITDGGYKADVEMLAAHARNHGMIVAMANHNAPTGGYDPAGKSGIWAPDGLLVAADEAQTALVIAEIKNEMWEGCVAEIGSITE